MPPAVIPITIFADGALFADLLKIYGGARCPIDDRRRCSPVPQHKDLAANGKEEDDIASKIILSPDRPRYSAFVDASARYAPPTAGAIFACCAMRVADAVILIAPA